VKSRIDEGSLFVCRAGLWHKTFPDPSVAVLYLTPGEGTENSQAKDRAASNASRAKGSSGLRRRASRRTICVQHCAKCRISRSPKARPERMLTPRFAPSRAGSVDSRSDDYSGLTPWERHPGADELLYALDARLR